MSALSAVWLVSRICLRPMGAPALACNTGVCLRDLARRTSRRQPSPRHMPTLDVHTPDMRKDILGRALVSDKNGYAKRPTCLLGIPKPCQAAINPRSA